MTWTRAGNAKQFAEPTPRIPRDNLHVSEIHTVQIYIYIIHFRVFRN